MACLKFTLHELIRSYLKQVVTLLAYAFPYKIAFYVKGKKHLY